jgi:hypothetical protein
MPLDGAGKVGVEGLEGISEFLGGNSQSFFETGFTHSLTIMQLLFRAAEMYRTLIWNKFNEANISGIRNWKYKIIL